MTSSNNPEHRSEQAKAAALDLDGRFDGAVHAYPLRVQYEDTDAGGIVYHAQYLAFAERGRSAWLRCLGVDQTALLAGAGKGFVVRHIEIDFMQPARLGTVLEVASRLIRLGGASLKLQQDVKNIEDGLILARLFVEIGFVDLAGASVPRACRLPAEITSQLSAVLAPMPALSSW